MLYRLKLTLLVVAAAACTQIGSAQVAEPPQPCSRPQNVQVVNLTDNQLTVRWTPQPGVLYDVSVKDDRDRPGTVAFNTVSGNESTLPILSPCTDYVVRVEAKCPCEGGFEAVEVGCSTQAPVPVGLAVQGVSFQQRRALLTWLADPALVYDLRVTHSNNQTSVVNGVSPLYTLEPLNHCLPTQVSLRARCPQGDRPSAYTAPLTIDLQPAQGCGTVALELVSRQPGGLASAQWACRPAARSWATGWALEYRLHALAPWRLLARGTDVEISSCRFQWPAASTGGELRVVLDCCGQAVASDPVSFRPLPPPRRRAVRAFRLPPLTY